MGNNKNGNENSLQIWAGIIFSTIGCLPYILNMPGLILIKDDVIAIASLTLIFSGALSFLHYIYNTKSAKKAFIASFFMLMVEALIYVEITFSGETSFLSAVTRVICTLGFMVGSAGMMLVAFTKEYRYSE